MPLARDTQVATNDWGLDWDGDWGVDWDVVERLEGRKGAEWVAADCWSASFRVNNFKVSGYSIGAVPPDPQLTAYASKQATHIEIRSTNSSFLIHLHLTITEILVEYISQQEESTRIRQMNRIKRSRSNKSRFHCRDSISPRNAQDPVSYSSS